MKKYIISIGLNDKDTKEQIVNTTQAQFIIEDKVAIAFGWGTIIPSRGVFRHEDGTIVRENSIRVETLAYASEEDAKDFCEDMKAIFNQESVLLEIVEVSEQFI